MLQISHYIQEPVMGLKLLTHMHFLSAFSLLLHPTISIQKVC